MWRRARKKMREEAAAEAAERTARELEERTSSRLRGIDGYDFDEHEAAEVEARIRRMTYGHKVEK
ncbi:MAG: hypothetical protein PVI35_04080 [Acidimicrobiia bacterium]|jgi:hypothetical protein